MKIVPDASVAVKWVVAEEDTPAARQMLTDANELHAPRLLAAEVANALWSKVRQGVIGGNDATSLIIAVMEWSINWADDESVAADALRIALELDQPISDCMYLALARRIGAVLVTADARFVNALARTEYRSDAVLLADCGGVAAGSAARIFTRPGPQRPGSPTRKRRRCVSTQRRRSFWAGRPSFSRA